MNPRIAWIAAAGLLGCAGESGGGLHTPPPDGSPPYDQVWQVSTHNTYWVNRGAQGDLFASGVEERILDQLLVDHARAIEIDIHRDPENAGGFLVHHTVPGNSLCATLAACLAEVRAFHRAVPHHEAIHVTLELKELTSSNFDVDHTIADLDAALSAELGELLYRPADFLSRCSSGATLSACAKQAGWPSIRELRGRFLVTLLGNWNGLPGAQATRDWADYAMGGDIQERSAFPMASSWQLDRGALVGAIHELVTQNELDRAWDQSLFLQVEELEDPRAPEILARRGVVRMDNAFSVAEQDDRIARGMQLLQTDTPWVQTDDRGPGEPFRALTAGFAPEVMREPGLRVKLASAGPGERVFAHATMSASATTSWETLVSSGADARRVGCLRAAAALGTAAETSFTACRTKIPAARGGASSPDAERVMVMVSTCRDGACLTLGHTAGALGDALRIEVANRAQGPSCVRVASASGADRGFIPRWIDVGEEACFDVPLRHQGISVPPATGGEPAPAWFFGTLRDAGFGLDYVGAAGFEGVAVEPAEGGVVREDPSLLEDHSAE